MKKNLKIIKNEDGQILVLVALLALALIGLVALTIDLGGAYVTKAKLQTAADAAALAGAQNLPDISSAKSAACNYAGLNGVQGAGTAVTATAPYDGDPNKIEAVCTKNVQYTFARVLGFTNTDVSARAVAQKSQWMGEALPFINLDDKYGEEGTILQGWEKVQPGDKERIHNDDLVISSDNTSIKVKYEDGSIMFKKGKDSSINAALDNILKAGGTVYMFSLSNEAIDSGDYNKGGPKELKNGDLIPLEDTVLLKCEVVEFENKLLTLKFVEVYNISEGVFPTDGPPKLIE